MILLIPSYEPDLRLATLVSDLRRTLPWAHVVVVDDGSGTSYAGIFDMAADAGATILRHTTNRGKGAALRTGLAWAAAHAPTARIVCADGDGQHTPTDIARVADAVAPATLVLGGRRFTGVVPARSRAGNAVSRWAFRALTGIRVHDTQTGLRGFAPDVRDWLLTVEGDRFEYEFNALLAARRAGVTITEVPIATIYLADNASSHFRPLVDSARIYAPVLRFAASSLTGYTLDVLGLLVLMAATADLVVSVAGARLMSASVTFALNRSVVFRHAGGRRRSAARYAALALLLLAANQVLMAALVSAWGWPLLAGKVVTEAALFGVSYVVQDRVVFADDTAPPLRSAAPPVGPGGVGHARTPPVHLCDGDEVAVEIEGVGRLAHRVVFERTPQDATRPPG